MRVRFHLDENVPLALAAALRRRAIDVTCTSEQELNGTTDEQQLDFASANQRIFVTQDKDFLRLHRKGARHWGIVFWRQDSVTIGAMLTHLVLIHDLMTAEEMRGQLDFA